MVPKIGENFEGFRTDVSSVRISDKFRPGRQINTSSSTAYTEEEEEEERVALGAVPAKQIIKYFFTCAVYKGIRRNLLGAVSIFQKIYFSKKKVKFGAIYKGVRRSLLGAV